MRFASPWALLLGPAAIAIVVAVARRGRRSVPRAQHKIAVGLRIAGVIALVLALAQPAVVLASPQKSVLFLLDRSASVTADAAAAQEAYVAAAVAGAGPEDLTAVAVFGKDLRLDAALATRGSVPPVRTEVDSSATDLAAALRGAAAVLPTEGSRRIVVLSDGVETVGDARAAVGRLAELGIAVDFITLDTGRSRDALVTRVDAPVVARRGDLVPVSITVVATTAGEATVVVKAGETELALDVELQVGDNVLTFEVPAGELGGMRIRAAVEAGFDEVPQNDLGEALVHVLGAPRVAVVEGVIGEGDDVARALEAGGFEADRLATIPTEEELLAFDALVLVNMPDPGAEQADILAGFVEDLGRGLVVIGGDQAFGLGNYQDGALEDLLPVASDPDDLIRRQPVAEVLVIDTSGSMADCHCGNGGDHDPSQQGGVNKTDISRAGAGLAIAALQPTDRVGLLAFTSGTRWALPLAEKPSDGVISEALAGLTPAGDTEISQALRVALEELRDAPEEIRHIVLFTDGWGDDPDLLQAARDVAAEGITLSVLGTGEGTGETLRRVAALGGGQFYPGRDLQEVPDIFVEETLRVARPLVAEGAFLPTLGAASQVTAGLTAAPPLRGYVLTKAKDTAQVLLEIGPGDPLLATWQRGLGRATTWASDATARWSTDWVSWGGYVDFWGRVVRDVLPPGRENPPEVRLDGGSLEIEYETEAPLDAVGIAQIRNSAGDVTVVPLQRVSETRFTGRAPISSEGAHWVAVSVESPNGLVATGSSGVVAGYSDEYAFRNPDPALGNDLASRSGGRVGSGPEAAYEPAPSVGAAERPLWPWLAGLALTLFLVDVAVRRLVVSRGDLEVWREQLKPKRLEPVAALETHDDVAPQEGEVPPTRREALPEEETLGRLLKRKRQ